MDVPRTCSQNPAHALPEPPVKITTVETFLFRAPAVPPVRTSFGVMHERPALLLRLTDADGCTGWGEVWCNFPTHGAEHRARLVEDHLAPLLCREDWPSPEACFDRLSARLRVLAIQTGEPGPLAQVVAAADMALWDLQARRAQVPLWRQLGGSPQVAVYASGINPDDPGPLVAAKAAEGYRAFKLKIGFDDARDLRNLDTLRALLGPDMALMVDANQAWDAAHAHRMARALEPYDLLWLEEPIAADEPAPVWRALADGTSLRLAGGENLRGLAQFQAAAHSGLHVLQPDIGKWGGFSGCLRVGRAALAQGQWFCPHWLGGGLGLQASLHLKAALGGPGYVEVDANPNPLRDLLAQPGFTFCEGGVTLGEAAGLGVEPDLERARPFLTEHRIWRQP